MSNYDIENKGGNGVTERSENYQLKIFNVSLNAWGHFFAGAVTAINILFAFRNGLPLTGTALHIVLCVVGYQFLMAEAIFALSPHNGWSTYLTFIDKRRAHIILQILGSGLALAGNFIKILDKEYNYVGIDLHWNTLHGQFALVSMVFTVACFFNGVTAMYPNKFRFIPGILSKLTHICFGIVAFVTASISLGYGYYKMSFQEWLSAELIITTLVFTALLTAIAIINPIVEFSAKSINALRK